MKTGVKSAFLIVILVALSACNDVQETGTNKTYNIHHMIDLHLQIGIPQIWTLEHETLFDESGDVMGKINIRFIKPANGVDAREMINRIKAGGPNILTTTDTYFIPQDLTIRETASINLDHRRWHVAHAMMPGRIPVQFYAADHNGEIIFIHYISKNRKFLDKKIYREILGTIQIASYY